MRTVIRVAAGVLVVAAFITAVLLFAHDADRDERVELPPAIEETPSFLVPNLRTAVALDASRNRLAPIRIPTLSDPPREEAFYVISYEAADAALGWTTLRHPSEQSPELRLTTLDGRGEEVRYVVRLGDAEYVVTERQIHPDTIYVSGDTFDGSAGPFEVTYARRGHYVEANFKTGQIIGDQVIYATVTGPDVESVTRFIAELTFRDVSVD